MTKCSTNLNSYFVCRLCTLAWIRNSKKVPSVHAVHMHSAILILPRVNNRLMFYRTYAWIICVVFVFIQTSKCKYMCHCIVQFLTLCAWHRMKCILHNVSASIHRLKLVAMCNLFRSAIWKLVVFTITSRSSANVREFAYIWFLHMCTCMACAKPRAHQTKNVRRRRTRQIHGTFINYCLPDDTRTKTRPLFCLFEYASRVLLLCVCVRCLLIYESHCHCSHLTKKLMQLQSLGLVLFVFFLFVTNSSFHSKLYENWIIFDCNMHSAQST